MRKNEVHFFIVYHCDPIPNDLWTGTGPQTGVWGPVIYTVTTGPSKENCITDVAPWGKWVWHPCCSGTLGNMIPIGEYLRQYQLQKSSHLTTAVTIPAEEVGMPTTANQSNLLHYYSFIEVQLFNIVFKDTIHITLYYWALMSNIEIFILKTRRQFYQTVLIELNLTVLYKIHTVQGEHDNKQGQLTEEKKKLGICLSS